MESYEFIWVLAGITGLAAAGLIGSGWSLLTGEQPTIWRLAQYRSDLPLGALAFVAYAPLGITKAGLRDIERNPAFGILLLAMGMLWSFLQGVFILTTFFGFT